jgi:hypothetical protein
MGERRRGVESMCGTIALVALACAAMTACTTLREPAGLASACQPTPQAPCFNITLNVTADGPYTISLGGATYQQSGNGTDTYQNLTPGTAYAVSGQMSTGHVAVTITG